MVVDMAAPIGLAHRDAAGRRHARRRAMRVNAGSNMTGSRRSEFEVHAGAGDLDDEIARTVERIGAAAGR